MKSFFAVGAAVLALASTFATAQTWPSKQVTLIIPAPPGGNYDTTGRIIGERLRAMFNVPFINESKAGAGGLLAVDHVSKAEPDGHTLLVTGNFLLFSPIIMGQARSDWKRDLSVVGSISFQPMVLEVHPSVEATTLQELIGLSKRKELALGAPGPGTSNHLASEMLQKVTGARWLTVQYKGNAPTITDLLGGHVNLAFDQLASSLPHVTSGRLRAIGVTSLKRAPALPNVPTLDESGAKGFEAETFTGLFAPPTTPRPVIEQIGKALARVLEDPAVVKRFADAGSEVRILGPEEFRRYLINVENTWVPLIKERNIRSN